MCVDLAEDHGQRLLSQLPSREPGLGPLATLTGVPTLAVVGPTVVEQDVAVGKLIAVFDRAEARDFVDVFEFCQRYEPALLLELAVRRDAGLGARTSPSSSPQPICRPPTRTGSRRSAASTPTGGRSCSVDLCSRGRGSTAHPSRWRPDKADGRRQSGDGSGSRPRDLCICQCLGRTPYHTLAKPILGGS